MSEEVEKRKFKVADNRRFDTDGNERDATLEEVERVLPDTDGKNNNGKNNSSKSAENSDGADEKVERKASKPAAEKTNPKRDTAAYDALSANTENLPEALSFGSFVISLATQALIQMGQMEAPDGADIPKDVQAAKQTIDLLGILEVKTRGNLDPDETQLMEQILHSLRLSYVNSVAK